MKVYNNSNKEIIEIKLEHLSIMLNTHKELEIYYESKHKYLLEQKTEEQLEQIVEEVKEKTINKKNKNKKD